MGPFDFLKGKQFELVAGQESIGNQPKDDLSRHNEPVYGGYDVFVENLANELVQDKKLRRDPDRFERILSRISFLFSSNKNLSLKEMLRDDDYDKDDWLFVDNAYEKAKRIAQRSGQPIINLERSEQNVNLDYITKAVQHALETEHQIKHDSR